MTSINQADKVAIGSAQATAVYVGSTKVWPPFKPTNLSGCCVWMDASKLNLANGAAVSSWTNLGSGSQPTITAGATFRTNALYNVMPCVRITQGTGKMRWYSGTGVDKDWTLIYVGRRWQLRPGRVVASFTTAANILVGFHNTEFECAHIEGWIYNSGPVGGITANTDWKMYSSDATSGGPARLFSDGVYLGQFYTPAKGWGGTLCISGYTDDTTVAASQEADCEIAELIMYNRKLSDAERQQIEAYLRYKWAPITAFKPTNLSGCVIWQDASQLALANGANVTSWPNLGTGPSPSIIGTPPATMRTNALNGKGVVKITGGQGRFRFAGTGITTDYTVAFVARRWSTRAGRVLAADTTASGGPNILFGFWSTRFDCVYVEGWGAPDNVHTDNLDWRIYTVDTTSSAAARLFKDGLVLRTTAATPAKGVSGTLTFSGHDTTSSEDADCEIAEVVMYNRKLTDPERTQVEQYLRLKWSPPPQTFKPLDLGVNLTAWFDGADAGSVIMAGAGVGQWINKGTGGLTLIQSTDANRPTFGNRAVSIGNPQSFVAANAPASYDVIWAGKPRPAAGNDWRTLLRSPTGGTESHQVIIETGTTRIGCYQGGFNPAGGLTWDNVYGIGYGRFSTSAVAMLSRDGGPLTSMGVTIAQPTFISFGAYQGPPPSQGFGDILEFILLPYNTADNIRQMLEGYLAWKWGLQGLLPAGHPYKAAAP